MTDQETEFKRAQEYIQKAPSNGDTSNEDKLKYYAYYKQATEGPATGKRPGVFDLVARYKYDAWAKLGKLSKEEAMAGYVKTLEQSAPEWRKYFEQTTSKL
ncbi:hypothetical protein AKO1_015625 [Acrasis kona]|uniref:ACB domain-containing protein n=1 Tax=Acrasis kona TaxID=1008807 RepID=A0AAW2ZGH0_9EUKA